MSILISQTELGKWIIIPKSMLQIYVKLEIPSGTLSAFKKHFLTVVWGVKSLTLVKKKCFNVEEIDHKLKEVSHI